MPSSPPRWVTLVVAVVACGAFALWDPPVRDLAAHTFRAELFEDLGFTIWNNTWYGGHYVLSYSVLFPPLAALLTPVWAAALAAVASAWLFDGLVRARFGAAGAWAGLWFAALGAVALLANGWLVFALGVAFALGALRALQAGRRGLALALAIATPLASPVAAAFLALIAVGAALVRRAGPWLWWLAAGALVPLALLGLLFPEAGEFPFWFSAWWPLALFCALALVAIRGLDSERDIRVVTLLYLALATVAWIAPNPLGGNLTRLGSLFGGPVLLAILLARSPARLRTPVALAALVVGLCWQVITPLPDTLQSLGDPATKRSYYAPAVDWLRAHGAARERIEIPYTFNHWETAYVSPDLSIARGWLRQLDLERNSLFYEGTLTRERYRRWLTDNAIRWVAASDARLDYSAQEEDDLVRSAPYLKLRATLDHWRIYEVVPRPPAVTAVGSGRARLRAVAPESFTLDVTRPGTFVVRMRNNPYWDADGAGACVGKAGKWTLIRAPRAGAVAVNARFDSGAAWRAIRGAAQDC